MKVFYAIVLLICTLSITAEEVHSNAEPSADLTKKLNIRIPRFKVGGLSIEKAIQILRDAVVRQDPNKKGINIIFLLLYKRVMNEQASSRTRHPKNITALPPVFIWPFFGKISLLTTKKSPKIISYFRDLKSFDFLN